MQPGSGDREKLAVREKDRGGFVGYGGRQPENSGHGHGSPPAPPALWRSLRHSPWHSAWHSLWLSP